MLPMKLIRQMIPPDLHPLTWIAGSAAITPTTARDVDVWVLGQADGQEVRDHARDEWPRLACWDECWVRDEDDHLWQHDPRISKETEGNYSEVGEFERKGIELVGNARVHGQTQPIQVLTINQPTIALLLASFDLSSSAWAIPLVTDHARQPHWHRAACAVGATLPTELPRVLMWATPSQTCGRLQRALESRGFDMTLGDHPDFARLQREIDAERTRVGRGTLPAAA